MLHMIRAQHKRVKRQQKNLCASVFPYREALTGHIGRTVRVIEYDEKKMVIIFPQIKYKSWNNWEIFHYSWWKKEKKTEISNRWCNVRSERTWILMCLALYYRATLSPLCKGTEPRNEEVCKLCTACVSKQWWPQHSYAIVIRVCRNQEEEFQIQDKRIETKICCGK